MFLKQFIVFNNIYLNLIRILCYRSTLVRYDLSAFYLSFLMFYIFSFGFLMQTFWHFNVIALYKLNIIIIIYNSYYMCAQFGNNCLQSYNELHVCVAI